MKIEKVIPEAPPVYVVTLTEAEAEILYQLGNHRNFIVNKLQRDGRLTSMNVEGLLKDSFDHLRLLRNS